MSSKRQQTMAKLTRERKVKERRELTLETKQAIRDAKAAEKLGLPPESVDSPPVDDDQG